jgi:Fe2+ transport system protein B
MRAFLWGALSMACVVAALIFARFYRLSRERLFVYFAAGFAMFGVHWTVLGAFDPANEKLPYVYLLRLAAFALILAGIVDRNRR